MDPAANAAISSGKTSREELRRQKKFELEAFGIGTNGDKPSEADLAKAYDEYKSKPDFRARASYTVKILQVPDENTGKTLLAELKRTGDFKGIAQKALGLSAADAANAGKEQTLLGDQLRPELRQALDALKPNEFTPQPVGIKIVDPQQPLNSRMVYAIAQLKRKEAEHTLTRSEVRFLLAPLVLQKTHPDWKEHYRLELAEFTKNSEIRIALQKYEGLRDIYFRPPPDGNSNPHAGLGIPAPPPGAGR
jgi:hypothetical protein